MPDYIQATIDIILGIHQNEGSGDILAFLTGQDDVERVCDSLRNATASMNREKHDKLIVLPLYSGLSTREQVKFQFLF